MQFLICNLKMLTEPVEYETPLNSLSLNGCPYCEGDTLFRQWEFAVVFSCCRERQYSTPTECDHILIPYKPTLFNVLPHKLNGIRTRARKVEKCSKNTFGTFHRWTGSLVAVDRFMTGYEGRCLAQLVEQATRMYSLWLDMKVASSKASIIYKQGWSEVQHLVAHMTVKGCYYK